MCRLTATYYDINVKELIKVSASESDDPKLERCLHNRPFKEFSHTSNLFSPVNNNVLVRLFVLNHSGAAKFWEMMVCAKGCAGKWIIRAVL